MSSENEEGKEEGWPKEEEDSNHVHRLPAGGAGAGLREGSLPGRFCQVTIYILLQCQLPTE